MHKSCTKYEKVIIEIFKKFYTPVQKPTNDYVKNYFRSFKKSFSNLGSIFS